MPTFVEWLAGSLCRSYRAGATSRDHRHPCGPDGKFHQMWADYMTAGSCGWFDTGSEQISAAQTEQMNRILTMMRVSQGKTLRDNTFYRGSARVTTNQEDY